MDSKNLENSSDSSKEESSDRSFNLLKEDDPDSFANKRFYGCIFCKRGFTNAQALGGHMNIHKKDRANKGKQSTSFSSSILQKKQIDQSTAFMNTHYFEPLLVRSQVSYEPSVSNPHGYFHELDGSSMHRWGSDLSLQIEPSKERIRLFNAQGVDLELRLGHDP